MRSSTQNEWKNAGYSLICPRFGHPPFEMMDDSAIPRQKQQSDSTLFIDALEARYDTSVPRVPNELALMLATTGHRKARNRANRLHIKRANGQYQLTWWLVGKSDDEQVGEAEAKTLEQLRELIEKQLGTVDMEPEFDPAIA